MKMGEHETKVGAGAKGGGKSLKMLVALAAAQNSMVESPEVMSVDDPRVALAEAKQRQARQHAWGLSWPTAGMTGVPLTGTERCFTLSEKAKKRREQIKKSKAGTVHWRKMEKARLRDLRRAVRLHELLNAAKEGRLTIKMKWRGVKSLKKALRSAVVV